MIFFFSLYQNIIEVFSSHIRIFRFVWNIFFFFSSLKSFCLHCKQFALFMKPTVLKKKKIHSCPTVIVRHTLSGKLFFLLLNRFKITYSFLYFTTTTKKIYIYIYILQSHWKIMLCAYSRADDCARLSLCTDSLFECLSRGNGTLQLNCTGHKQSHGTQGEGFTHWAQDRGHICLRGRADSLPNGSR